MIRECQDPSIITSPAPTEELLLEESETFDLGNLDKVKFLSFVGLVEKSVQNDYPKEDDPNPGLVCPVSPISDKAKVQPVSPTSDVCLAESVSHNPITASEDMEEFEDTFTNNAVNVSCPKFLCSECRLKFKSEESLEMHNVLKHSEPECGEDDDDGDINFGIEGKQMCQDRNLGAKKVLTGNAKKQVLIRAKGPKPKSKIRQLKCKKQKATSKLVKSLRDEELEGNKIFQEKVEVKDGFYYCKICSKFSTTTKLIARAHVVSCGKSKRKGRPKKTSECLQCYEKFASIKEMHRHHSKEHSSQTYCCSTCLKTFTRRQAYARHLRSHREIPQMKCHLCDKVFRYKCSRFGLKTL